MADPRGPTRPHGHAGGKVVCDGTDQEATDGSESGGLDPEATVAAAGAGDEDAAVEDDEGKFEEAEGGCPGDFFDEEGLSRKTWLDLLCYFFAEQYRKGKA